MYMYVLCLSQPSLSSRNASYYCGVSCFKFKSPLSKLNKVTFIINTVVMCSIAFQVIVLSL